MEKAKNLILKVWPVLYLLTVLLFAINLGLQRIYTVEFVPTNGDFQTYNILRRFLAGQKPFVEFANYLGMGTIFCCAPMLAFNNSFSASLFASHFVTAILFNLAVFAVLYLITKRGAFSAITGLCFSQLISSHIFPVIPALGYYIDYTLNLLLQPGNSLRMVRMAWPYLLALLAAFCVHRYSAKHSKRPDVFKLAVNKRFCKMAGFIVGFGIVWSNDFGFSVIGTASLILIALMIAENGKNIKAYCAPALCYFLSLLLGAVLSILLASGGNIKSWVSFAFGVASWQFWYYGTDSSKKIHGFSQLLASGWEIWVILLFVLVVSLVFLKKLRQKSLTVSFVLYEFLCLSMFFAFAIYIYGSGYNGFSEGMIFFILVSLLGFVAKGVAHLITARRVWMPVNAVFSLLLCAFVIFRGWSDIRALQTYRQIDFSSRPEYSAALKGISSLTMPIQQQVQLTEDGSVFSLYATALEVEKATFQPTGTDYIIHALGDEKREQYLGAFTNGQYPYVQTLHTEYGWEPWISRANWDFYRLLYKDYRVFEEVYPWTLWEKTEKNSNLLVGIKVDCEIRKNSDNSIDIIVNLPVQGEYIVDVEVRYTSKKEVSLYGLQTWKYSVFVEDPAVSAEKYGYSEYSIPRAAEAHYLPVLVNNGEGSIRLFSVPEECTYIEVQEAQAINVYDVDKIFGLLE